MTAPSPEGTPRWVKVFAVVLGLLVVLLLVGLLAGVDHGPGRHAVATSLLTR